MHALVGSRAGRGQDRRQGSHRRVYTGSIGETCNFCRCMSIMSFGSSGLSAISGILLAVFGWTDFFRTAEMNRTLIIVGVVLLLMALVFLALGFVFSKRVPQQTLELSPPIPTEDEEN